ncbi:hypothetical protein ARMGADRAFT_132215 [Armillaria gallica]|uniref:Uncharacterized protein n=1 Tax=Armillaria gallica TaxID=47427 RepID=A0A2H3DIL1_ARMGA|nr:hypothetical protein ARMGADRAFT_132215 [Armillaria gallica]
MAVRIPPSRLPSFVFLANHYYSIICLNPKIITAFKIIYIHRQLTDGTIDDLLTPVLYASSSLATTHWSTLLIIYRVWTVGQTNERGLGAYRHVVEVSIESSALYSASLILFVAFFAHDWAANYLDPITGIARGVAPTLLVGRVAAGHARPDDSWEGSIMTSLLWARKSTGERSGRHFDKYTPLW